MQDVPITAYILAAVLALVISVGATFRGDMVGHHDSEPS